MGQYQLLGKQAQQKMPNTSLVELEDTGHLQHIGSSETFIGPLKVKEFGEAKLKKGLGFGPGPFYENTI